MMRWGLLKILKESKEDETEGMICLDKLEGLDAQRIGRYKDLRKQITEK